MIMDSRCKSSYHVDTTAKAQRKPATHDTVACGLRWAAGAPTRAHAGALWSLQCQRSPSEVCPTSAGISRMPFLHSHERLSRALPPRPKSHPRPRKLRLATQTAHTV
eukprot:3817517-Prymnesium_polylepis.1